MEPQQSIYDGVNAEFDRIHTDALSMGLSADLDAFPETRLAMVTVLAAYLHRIESKLDEQVELIQRLVELLAGDNSPNLPSAEDVRGILKGKDGKDE